MTLGDSWGTDLVSEMKQGVSLLLCQTDKGKMLLDMANLVLYDVNIQQALASNGNLSHPSVAPSTRDEFFEKLSTGANYDKLVMKAFPKQCIRQNIKAMAIKLKLK